MKKEKYYMNDHERDIDMYGKFVVYTVYSLIAAVIIVWTIFAMTI